jgi:hypothetical protein
LLWSYRQAVLLANVEAENAIVSFLKSQERLEFQLQAAKAADETNERIIFSLEEGVVDFNRVFNVQNFKTQQEESAALAKGEVAQSLIAIYRALGGGWPSPYLGQSTIEGFAPVAAPEPGENTPPTGEIDEQQAELEAEVLPRPAEPLTQPDGLQSGE